MTETRPHAPRAPRVRNGQVRAIKRKYLLADPLNWHTHPPEQRRALAAVFAEIGFVGHLLVRPAPGQRNRWYIVDGHERAEHFGPEDLVPCCVLDVAEAEARKLLKAYDPIGYLSGVDREILAKLSAEASFEAEGLEEAIAATLERQGRDEWWPGAAKVPQDDVPAPETDKAAALARKWKAAPGQVWMCRAASGRAHRVTIAEDRPELREPRARMFDVIRECPDLHFQLLTKRPENAPRSLPDDWGRGWHNVWLGTSIEDLRVAWRADALRQVPARIRFVSYEPALGSLDDLSLTGLHWVIYGGESGPGYRPENKDWARTMRDRCREAGVAFFHKQSAASRTEMGIELDGELVREFPRLERVLVDA